MSLPSDAQVLDRLFREARSHNAWSDRPVTDEQLRELYNVLRWGPTSTNANPGRFVFVRSAEGKARLAPCLAEGNVPKMMAAPCCVVIAWDSRFPELLPQLLPGRDLQAIYAGKDELIRTTGERNSTLQGAYLMIAARALGFDVGAMSGFDQAAVDRAFFPDGRWQSNFLCNIGHGRHEELYPRNPRLSFEEACLLA